MPSPFILCGNYVGRLVGGSSFEKFVSWGIVSRGSELKTVTIPIFLKSIPGHQTNICSMFQNFLKKKKIQIEHLFCGMG